MKNRWLLPEGISDLLPDAAQDLEGLRRALLDTYRRHGFELVLPPLVEYLDSLLIGSGGDLDLKTFKLVDQLSGQSLGVRADITPQVSRIDAHLLQQRDINRLCYAASVLRTRPSGQEGSREPIQIGAEVYGHAGIEADIEIIDLLLQSLALAELGPVRLDINHLGLASLLLAELDGIDEEAVLQLLQARDLPGLRELLAPWSQPAAAALLALPECFGPAESAMARARTLLAPWPQATPILTHWMPSWARCGWPAMPDRCPWPSIWPTCRAFATTPGWALQPTSKVMPGPWDVAAAMTASVPPSGALARPPAFRSTCANSSSCDATGTRRRPSSSLPGPTTRRCWRSSTRCAPRARPYCNCCPARMPSAWPAFPPIGRSASSTANGGLQGRNHEQESGGGRHPVG